MRSDRDTHAGPDPGAVVAALRPVRQRVRAHGGEIDLVAIEADGSAEVEFVGACRGCPAIAVTYATAVRPALMAVEGVTDVKAPQVRVSDAALARLAAAFERTAKGGSRA